MLDWIHLIEGRGAVFWALERSQKYSTKSLYKLMLLGVIDHYMMEVWKCNIPRKVQIFFCNAPDMIVYTPGVELKMGQYMVRYT